MMISQKMQRIQKKLLKIYEEIDVSQAAEEEDFDAEDIEEQEISAGDKMNRKIPTRKCIGCGELKEKNQLVRIVRSKEGEISLDMTGKKNGRGAYICPDPQCLKQAFKKKGLDRSFKIGVPESVYETLKKEMEELYE